MDKKIGDLGSTIEGWLGDIQPQSEWPSLKRVENHIFWRVGCVKMSAPRHPRFEWLLMLGSLYTHKIFSNETIIDPVLTFVFPERFMSVHEQQKFTWAIGKHKDVGKIKQIDIITSSPLIIGSFHHEQIRILTWDDDTKHNGCTQNPIA